MADIGAPQREVTFEPLTTPAPLQQPEPEPAQPVTVPEREPVPA